MESRLLPLKRKSEEEEKEETVKRPKPPPPPFEIQIPFNMIIAGHTNSGKTYLLKQILRSIIPEFDIIVIMSQTLHLNDDFEEWKENTNPKRGPIIYKYDDHFETHLKQIIEESRGLVERNKEDAPDVLIVFEDQANQPITAFQGAIDRFALLSRHHKISMIITTQRIAAIGRTIRLNTRYMVMFNASNFSELERFLEENVSQKYKKAIREHAEDIYSQPYTYVLIRNFETNHSKRLFINGTIPLHDYLKTVLHHPETPPPLSTPKSSKHHPLNHYS